MKRWGGLALCVAIGLTLAGCFPGGGGGGGKKPPSVLLTGDSIAQSALPGLSGYLAVTKHPFRSVARLGCAVVTGRAAYDDGRYVYEPPFYPQDPCLGTAFAQVQAVNESDPDLVIWFSSWESSSRYVGSPATFYGYGTAEWGVMLQNLFLEAHNALTAKGAHIVYLTIPPVAPGGPHGNGEVYNPRMNDVNQRFRSFAQQQPTTATYMRIENLVCPGGPPDVPGGVCPTHVGGVLLRPDGAHFSQQGAQWLAERVLPLILANCRPSPRKWDCPDEMSA